MANTKLHELLAVENGLAETANRISKEVAKTLETKQSLFAGLHKAHTIFDDQQQHLVQAPEIKEVESTVDEQLSFLSTHLAAYYDVSLQKEEANQRAFADIVIDGVIIVPKVPSIVLLAMEKKLLALSAVYNVIPTLDSAKAWEIDPNYSKPFVYRTKYTTERQQTQTTKDWIEVSPATKEHKAQVAQQDTTKVVGKFTITEFSGATTSLDKANKLQRLTALLRAVKAARQRANDVEVDTTLRFGRALIDYING